MAPPTDRRVPVIAEREVEMENRTILIIVAVVVLMALLCCCAILGGAGIAALFTAVPSVSEGGIGRVEERMEQTFNVGDAPVVEVDGFAGNITVEAGESGSMRVVVTKRASSSEQLDAIGVDVAETEEGVVIRTSSPGGVTGYRTVDIEVTVPPDAHLSLSTDAGNVNVENVQGPVKAHSGAGNVRAYDARGPISLDTGAGAVEYHGDPRGECAFQTGAGSVMLHLPGDLNARVHLRTGIGSINLGSFDVDGQTGGTEVDGVIGSGEDATIEATTGAGSIRLAER